MNKLFKQAFTLIELLVVIAIIGILSGLIVVSMGGMTTKATIAKAQVFSNSLKNSLIMNLVSEWKFDELTTAIDNTSIFDSWNGGNNGILDINSLATDTAEKLKSGSDCIFGKCLYFDGVDDYVQLSGKMKIGAKTIALWVYPIDPIHTNPVDTLLAETDVTNNSYGNLIFWDHANHRFGWYLYHNIVSDFYINLTSSTLSPSNWYYLVLTWDGTTSANGLKCYINGNINNQATATGIETVAPTNNMKIGNDYYSTSGGRYFKGTIDDIRIYDTIMPTSQIKEQYYAGLNNLLTNGSINLREYSKRINSITVQ